MRCVVLIVLSHADGITMGAHPTRCGWRTNGTVEVGQGSVSSVPENTCKGWRDAHDESETRLSVIGDFLLGNSMLGMRFPRVKKIGVRCRSSGVYAHPFYNDQWLRSWLASPTSPASTCRIASKFQAMGYCAH
jgi:hypothetical protein